MSALPPKADIDEMQLDVRFVPKADQVQRGKMQRLLDRLWDLGEAFPFL